MTAARGGASVVLLEQGERGRDKICGDGLTPRAVAAMDALGVPLDGAHRISGLRMMAGRQVRELPWPASGRFPGHGAVWPRRRLDAALIDEVFGLACTVVPDPVSGTPMVVPH